MNFIKKINKYLLEHYPLVWNTRLVWMLGIGIFTHLLFFLLGHATIQNIADLKEEYQLANYYSSTSILYYNILLSIFILLIWVLFYLRNNAFKNHYALKRGMLFTQFCYIFLIFFINITQYYSFKQGLITKVKQLHNWEEIDADIKSFNKTALFLTRNYDDYEISKKKYPAPFPLEVAYENIKDQRLTVDTSKHYIEYNGFYFQFYKFNEELWKKDVALFGDNQVMYKDELKYRIVKDVSNFKEFIHPSLFNYSGEMFGYGQDSLDYKKQLKGYEEILNKGNERDIKNSLKEFISLANKYEIKHNLTVYNWFLLIDNKPNYLLKELINSIDPKDRFEYNYSIDENLHETYKAATGNGEMDYITSVPYSKTLYCNLVGLDNFFKNVHESYNPKFEIEFLYFLIAFSFILGVILFVFKTTDLKSLLLSFVAAIAMLVVVVLCLTYARSIGYYLGLQTYMEVLMLMAISITILIFARIAYVKLWRKVIVSILFTLGLFALPSIVLSTVMLYDKYMRAQNILVKGYRNPFMQWFDTYGFWLVMFIWLIAVFVYCKYIKLLKVRPE
ncbi:hypothetical protein [uncultured Tenacibaculum sp.]|uniref:hypothetical protein n=1 Tax=uncultured Tenacibaculum sp. TaxID=174713 RepID=UPI002616BBFD|nr:hypothetical protein [uncultured Tenacibaculum sp.]